MKTKLLIQTLLIKLAGIIIFFYGDEKWIGLLIFFSAGAIVMLHLGLPRSQLICPTYYRFKTAKKECWLTIDDGPNPTSTRKILDILDQYKSQVTFFVIGKKADEHPELIKEIISRGHTIGNHTYHHPISSFWFLGIKRTALEIDRTQKVLLKLGVDSKYFRSPVGIKNLFLKRLLKHSHLKFISWSVRSGDTLTESPQTIAKTVLKHVHPGAIILMHDSMEAGLNSSTQKLEATLKALGSKGYRCVIPQSDSLLSYKSH